MADHTDVEALSLDELRVLVGHLQCAVASHGVVGQAIGVLVAVHQMPPAQAWDLLRTTSQNTNIKVIRLATGVVEAAAGLAPTDDICRAVVRAALLPSAESATGVLADDGVMGEVRQKG